MTHPLFDSLYHDDAASFRRANAALFRRPNAALFRRAAALFRRVCDALCFARLGVGPLRCAALRIAAASAIEDFHKKAERFGYM